MAVVRDTPYGAFNFIVELNDGTPSDGPLGGFSDVSGIGTEITLMEYRQGNDRENRVRKIPGLHKATDVTLRFFGVGFLPYIEDAAGNLAPAW